MGELESLIQKKGWDLDPADVSRAVAEAVEAAGGYPPYPDPAVHLTSEQRKLLAEGGLDMSPRKAGPDDPVLRGAFEYAALSTTALTTQTAAKRLGVNDSRVRQRLKKRELYGIKVNEEWRLPRFQFTADGLVPNISHVIGALREDLSPVAVQRWFSSAHVDLVMKDGTTVSPVQWLLMGEDASRAASLASGL